MAMMVVSPRTAMPFGRDVLPFRAELLVGPVAPGRAAVERETPAVADRAVPDLAPRAEGDRLDEVHRDRACRCVSCRKRLPALRLRAAAGRCPARRCRPRSPPCGSRAAVSTCTPQPVLSGSGGSALLRAPPRPARQSDEDQRTRRVREGSCEIGTGRRGGRSRRPEPEPVDEDVRWAGGDEQYGLGDVGGRSMVALLPDAGRWLGIDRVPDRRYRWGRARPA